ncbi:MAG: hypothetical protein HC893_10355, partial [Chloroflexaceae bacterium]|nr:hypothetical protein [Chloroflexaceae bacterium]
TMSSMLGGLVPLETRLDGTANTQGCSWYAFGGPRRVDVLWRTGEHAPLLRVACGCRKAVVRQWDGSVRYILAADNGMLLVRPRRPWRTVVYRI